MSDLSGACFIFTRVIVTCFHLTYCWLDVLLVIWSGGSRSVEQCQWLWVRIAQGANVCMTSTCIYLGHRCPVYRLSKAQFFSCEEVVVVEQ